MLCSSRLDLPFSFLEANIRLGTPKENVSRIPDISHVVIDRYAKISDTEAPDIPMDINTSGYTG